MRSRPFASADPFLRIILLFLLMFSCLGVFMLMAQGLTSSIFGLSFFDNPEVLKQYGHPHAIYVNWILLFFQHLGLFVVPAILFAMLVSHEPKEVLALNSGKPILMLAAALLMLASMPMVNALAWANELLTLPDWLAGLEMSLQDMEQQAQQLTGLLTGSSDWRFLLVNILVMAAIPAIGEEMIFRGLLLRILESWSGRTHAAVWISAVLFSAMHLQFYGFLPRMVLGVILGYLLVWTRSLWVPIAAHFINNAVALILMYFIAKGDIDEDLDGFSPVANQWLLLSISIALVVVLAIFIKKRGRILSVPAKEKKASQ